MAAAPARGVEGEVRERRGRPGGGRGRGGDAHAGREAADDGRRCGGGDRARHAAAGAAMWAGRATRGPAGRCIGIRRRRMAECHVAAGRRIGQCPSVGETSGGARGGSRVFDEGDPEFREGMPFYR